MQTICIETHKNCYKIDLLFLALGTKDPEEKN